MINKAYNFAKAKHAGQIDDEGKDYFQAHLMVAHQALCLFVRPWEDLNLCAAVFLHDTIEDTDTTYEELVEEFNKDIADLVMEVTSEGKKDHFGRYFPRLRTKRGIILKFADRLSNLTRMNAWDKERQDQYLKRSRFWRQGQLVKPCLHEECEKFKIVGKHRYGDRFVNCGFYHRDSCFDKTKHHYDKTTRWHQIQELERESHILQTKIRNIKRECKHVIVRRDFAGISIAECSECRKHFGWWCPKSDDGVCEYPLLVMIIAIIVERRRRGNNGI